MATEGMPFAACVLCRYAVYCRKEPKESHTHNCDCFAMQNRVYRMRSFDDGARFSMSRRHRFSFENASLHFCQTAALNKTKWRTHERIQWRKVTSVAPSWTTSITCVTASASAQPTVRHSKCWKKQYRLNLLTKCFRYTRSARISRLQSIHAKNRRIPFKHCTARNWRLEKLWVFIVWRAKRKRTNGTHTIDRTKRRTLGVREQKTNGISWPNHFCANNWSGWAR